MLASGVAELVSLGAVLPFLAVISDPEKLWQQALAQDLANWLGFTEPVQLVLPATLAFAAAALTAGLIRLTNLWLSGRLAAAVGSDLSCSAYKNTLYQSYATYLNRNSAAVITAITTQINQTVGALNSLLQLVTSAVVATGLLTGLILINAPVALAAVSLFGAAYVILATTSKRELRTNSHQIAEASTKQVKALQEGLGAIRDVLLDSSQPTYLSIYRQADRPQRRLQAKNGFLGAFPRYALEALGMVAIALLGGLLVSQRGSGVDVVTLLGAMALGAQRLLPALQQMYAGWASLKGYNASMKAVLEMLNLPSLPHVPSVEPFPLRDGIGLVGVHFCYGVEQPDVLRGIDLEIRRGERIGLIGSTGSGKTTAFDLLMGLLEPTSGKVIVDGYDLHDQMHPERLAAWRAAIAHVPQNIYLADSSIAENIAFGVPRQHIDFDRVKHAAMQAQIASFIEASPLGYDSFVGERGIRLSGGQRQRIGIARALYKRASVIFLDEATSALDSITEKAVIESLEGLSHDLTIIMIAHRLSTVQTCDRLISLDSGKVVKEGSPLNVLQGYSVDS